MYVNIPNVYNSIQQVSNSISVVLFGPKNYTMVNGLAHTTFLSNNISITEQNVQLFQTHGLRSLLIVPFLIPEKKSEIFSYKKIILFVLCRKKLYGNRSRGSQVLDLCETKSKKRCWTMFYHGEIYVDL